ncbi:hypothetical protein [Empedobacter brevis]|uniref:hypothetical protein n=1 Tax=Empedobacter brevis TaxID=247 RepID=UPI0028D51721|nr:hypothetical protein [Empedobacter brevis]
MSTQEIADEKFIRLIIDCIIIHRLINEINSLTMSISANSFYPSNYQGIYAIIDCLGVTDDELSLQLENNFLDVVANKSTTFSVEEEAKKLYVNFIEIIKNSH